MQQATVSYNHSLEICVCGLEFANIYLLHSYKGILEDALNF